MLLPSCDSHHENHEKRAHGHGHEEAGHDEDIRKGPHGGRMLTHEIDSGDFSLEITIYETGLPPEFRVYAYRDDKPLAPELVSLSISLKRLGDKIDQIKFIPQYDYLRGDAIIYEPHSFAVKINAGYDGKSHQWQYDNFEGRTRIAGSMADEMSIKTETAGPISLAETRTLTGRVQTSPNRLSRVHPRFPGVIKKINRELGDWVNAGTILATIESNESLQNYQVKAPINGIIVKRDIQVGEATGDMPLFVIVDHSDVWVELDVFVHDLAVFRAGQAVQVETLDGRHRLAGSIDWISPLISHASQSVHARVRVKNVDDILRPGQFVRGFVIVAEHEVELAVKQSAIQSFRDFQVVFAKVDDTYEVRMLELGRRNKDWVEVLGGIEPGTEYVTENSYLIKADIEKSGASHDH